MKTSFKKESIGPDEELRTFSIRINSNKLNKKVLSLIYSYRHFENILLILLKQNYEPFAQSKGSSDFKYLTNKQTLRNALLDYKAKNSKDADCLNGKYKDNQLWQDLKKAAKIIKQHNFVYIVDRVKSNYKTYFANTALWHKNHELFTGKPQHPKPKKLSKLTNYAVDIDKSDIGVNNLAAVFVNDKTTPSLVIDGTPFKRYNAKFNRLVSKLNEAKSKEVSNTQYPIEYTQKGKNIIRFISFLHSKRNKYFYDQFHKVSKRIVAYLQFANVADLYLSKSLSELKNNGECKLRKVTKQNFMQIPFFIKLLKNIEYKAQEKGINVHWINEVYSSKSSCISDNVVDIQNNPQLTNAFNGRRVKRGLFLDTWLNKTFNADINGAVNHIKIATAKNFEWLKSSLYKLCNPIKLKSDYKFCRLLKHLQNSGLGKSVFFANQNEKGVVSVIGVENGRK
ncbi:Mobile element protein [Desulfurella amilsii]|uniref:Mobile element protein n=1 Tax=Desulfurella amilsii TaxID=1562698 RepID=A0A1X4XYK4_9BACT|nr:transposase [Desulfurella amilsii]OSS42605.1 Mobile element protein [Desulfurella amilsii]